MVWARFPFPLLVLWDFNMFLWVKCKPPPVETQLLGDPHSFVNCAFWCLTERISVLLDCTPEFSRLATFHCLPFQCHEAKCDGRVEFVPAVHNARGTQDVTPVKIG